MLEIVVLGGSGDAYLVCALMEAFRGQHHGREFVVTVRARLAAVPEMFSVPYHVNDALVSQAESDTGFQACYDNDRTREDQPFYAHPCFLRSGARVDAMTTRPDASQADMYRMILGLPVTAPLALPRLPSPESQTGAVTVLTESTSWPNTQPGFWPKLGAALVAAGWDVAFNDPEWSLTELLERCAASEWVIGPQCGVMSMLVTGRFPCRKTLATPSLDGNRRPEYLAPETYPYGYVTKFSGEDYDVEEMKIEDGNHDEVIGAILNGLNARPLRVHDPRPVMTVSVPLSPGDFLDRLAVLTVKHARFAPEHRAQIDREYRRHAELRRQITWPQGADDLFARLVLLHKACYDVLAELVPATIASYGSDHAGHIEVIRANRQRVEMKNKIDALCCAPYTEVKDYYG